MMRSFFPLPVMLLIGACTPERGETDAPRPQIMRDAESYAIASCLTKQSQPYLQDKGDAWASVIVQRMQGSPDVFAGIAEQVARESAKGEMPVMRSEAATEKDKALPLLYCGEIIDKPAVRAEIKKAIAKFRPS